MFNLSKNPTNISRVVISAQQPNYSLGEEKLAEINLSQLPSLGYVQPIQIGQLTTAGSVTPNQTGQFYINEGVNMVEKDYIDNSLTVANLDSNTTSTHTVNEFFNKNWKTITISLAFTILAALVIYGFVYCTGNTIANSRVCIANYADLSIDATVNQVKNTLHMGYDDFFKFWLYDRAKKNIGNTKIRY